MNLLLPPIAYVITGLFAIDNKENPAGAHFIEDNAHIF
jgi:hypothetical protein